MEARTVHLHVDVVVEGSVISGEVTVLEGGPVRRFSGRLGLITAIEQALNVPDGEGPAPNRGPDRCAPTKHRFRWRGVL
jgi:hypothetical protein